MKYQIINGKIVTGEEARIPINDLALLRGFGAFDYFKVLRGIPVFIEDHLHRLFFSASQLGIDIAFSKEEIQRMCESLIAQNAVEEASIRIVITGGFAEDGYTPDKSNLFIMMHALPGYDPSDYELGINLISHPYQRDIPTAKTTLYLQALLHRQRMQQFHAVDVLYHWDGIIRETSRANIFFVDQNDHFLTPFRDVLGGVTRKNVMNILKEIGHLEMTDIQLNSITGMREAFITSTTKGVMPVVRIDDRIIGDGKVGPMTKKVRERFLKVVQSYINQYEKV